MMSGEFEFQDSFTFEESVKDKGQWSTQFAFVFFLIAGTIVIGNLLIALTITSTEKLLSDAHEVRLQKIFDQVQVVDTYSRSLITRNLMKCCSHKRTTRLFNFLKRDQKDQPSPWKICVKPNSFRSRNNTCDFENNTLNRWRWKRWYPTRHLRDLVTFGHIGS